ncbi:MAG: hypothetical protein VYD19_00995 [Myxococcota bacterium]|nr:hypothetical protein [Myxococcota bacterium]
MSLLWLMPPPLPICFQLFWSDGRPAAGAWLVVLKGEQPDLPLGSMVDRSQLEATGVSMLFQSDVHGEIRIESIQSSRLQLFVAPHSNDPPRVVSFLGEGQAEQLHPSKGAFLIQLQLPFFLKGRAFCPRGDEIGAAANRRFSLGNAAPSSVWTQVVESNHDGDFLLSCPPPFEQSIRVFLEAAEGLQQILLLKKSTLQSENAVFFDLFVNEGARVHQVLQLNAFDVLEMDDEATTETKRQRPPREGGAPLEGAPRKQQKVTISPPSPPRRKSLLRGMMVLLLTLPLLFIFYLAPRQGKRLEQRAQAGALSKKESRLTASPRVTGAGPALQEGKIRTSEETERPALAELLRRPDQSSAAVQRSSAEDSKSKVAARLCMPLKVQAGFYGDLISRAFSVGWAEVLEQNQLTRKTQLQIDMLLEIPLAEGWQRWEQGSATDSPRSRCAEPWCQGLFRLWNPTLNARAVSEEAPVLFYQERALKARFSSRMKHLLTALATSERSLHDGAPRPCSLPPASEMNEGEETL